MGAVASPQHHLPYAGRSIDLYEKRSTVIMNWFSCELCSAVSGGFKMPRASYPHWLRPLSSPTANLQSGPRVLINDIEEPDMTATRGHIRLKIEAENMHGIPGGQPLLLAGSKTGTPLLTRLGLHTLGLLLVIIVGCACCSRQCLCTVRWPADATALCARPTLDA